MNVKILLKPLEVKKQLSNSSEMLVAQVLDDSGKPLPGASFALALPEGMGLMDAKADTLVLTLAVAPKPAGLAAGK